MATNAKKYKYSLFNKTVCVAVCIVCAMIACFLSASVALTVANNNKNGSNYNNYIETNTAREHIVRGIEYAASLAANPDTAEFKDKLVAQKYAACNAVYNDFIDMLENGDDLVGVVSTYLPNEEYATKFDYEFSDSDNINNVYESISKAYDSYVYSAAVNYETELKTDAHNQAESNGIVYSISNPTKKYSDIYGVASAEKILSSKKYIVIKNGVATVKGLSADTKEYIMQSDTLKNKNYVLYAAVDEDGVNYLTTYRDFYYFAKGVNDNLYLLGLIDIVMVVLSISAAFYYFQITGRKDEDGAVKLWFIDWIPFEIQLALVGGITAAAIYLLTLLDCDFMLLALAYMAACAAILAALFLFATSFARYVHSDKKFHKHLLLYWIFYAIVFAVKKLASLFHKIVNVFDYKPKAFKKNIVLAIAVYALVNIVFTALIVVFNGAGVIVNIDGVFNLVFIVAIAKNAINYFKTLDRIIDLSAQHSDIDMELEKLPQSLKILAESMKYTNTELENAIAKAVKDERLRAELITNVSHDLKTPLTSIINYVDLLQKCDINDEKAKEYIGVLDEKGAKLKRLIDDLLEASKVTSGNVTVHLAPMNLSELCLQSTVDVQQDFENAGLSLIVKQGEKPVNVIADGAKTYRVIENLLSNARKYSAKGSRVYVSVYRENANGVFEIKNISAKPLDISPDELTERFVRGDKSRNEDGNGLGLSIAKELCKLQNGKLDISIDGDLFKAKVIFASVDI